MMPDWRDPDDYDLSTRSGGQKKDLEETKHKKTNPLSDDELLKTSGRSGSSIDLRLEQIERYLAQNRSPTSLFSRVFLALAVATLALAAVFHFSQVRHLESLLAEMSAAQSRADAAVSQLQESNERLQQFNQQIEEACQDAEATSSLPAFDAFCRSLGLMVK